MPALPWYRRAWGSVATWTRSALATLGVLQKPPPGVSGVTSRLIATNLRAEKDLEAMALSPTVFAAIQRRALTFSVYPIRVYQGWSIGGRRVQPIDPAKIPWVASLLRLLQAPDPRDQEAIFPACPGETLFSQTVADLILTGNAFVAVQTTPEGDIIGLYRLHPKLVTLDRSKGEEHWVYRPVGQEARFYPRRSVAHLKLLSWQASGAGELGTGAASSLRYLVEAEVTSLQQTAQVVGQGGADVLVTGKSVAGSQYLSAKENRERVAQEMSVALAGEEGRRVFVVSGDLEVRDSGLTPADVKAPELLKVARGSELAAIGVVPVAVGSDAGTYATAVQQYRTQAELDEQVAAVLEAGLLRPLCRHFARRSGQPRTMIRADEFTARFDLSSHPGYAYLRTEQINRMSTLISQGWSASQAAEAEGLDLPLPEGKPNEQPEAAPNNSPRAPLGDAEPRVYELFPEKTHQG